MMIRKEAVDGRKKSCTASSLFGVNHTNHMLMPKTMHQPMPCLRMHRVYVWKKVPND
jgi:hypothetical protein